MNRAELLTKTHKTLRSNLLQSLEDVADAWGDYADCVLEMRTLALEGSPIPAETYRRMLRTQQDLESAQKSVHDARRVFSCLAALAAHLVDQPPALDGGWSVTFSENGDYTVFRADADPVAVAAP